MKAVYVSFLVPIALIVLLIAPAYSQQPTAAAASQPASGQNSAPTGHLAFSVVIIDDLTPKPVPLTDFTITDNSGKQAPQTIRTDAQGQITADLPPGTYTIASAKAVEFKDHSYSWNKTFTIQAGQQTKLDLTDADANVASVSPAHQMTDEGEIYQAVNSGVVTVECDFGSGSGFVVDKRGLVLTNQHVTDGTHWVALRFGAGIRVNAWVVEEDKDADVAVLCFNPQAVKNFCVLPLADPSQGPLAVIGERVLAIGSPLHQDKILTTGIVSKVDNDVLISDININHGNSGGPLLDLSGNVIGITTFMDVGAPNGPGISGIISIQKALPVLTKAKEDLAQRQLPPPDLLPDISSIPVPDEALDAASTGPVLPAYIINAPKNFQTTIYTPFIVASQESIAEKLENQQRNERVQKRSSNGVYDPSETTPHRFYERYAVDNRDAVVAFQVTPVLKPKGLILGIFTTDPTGKVQMEYRDDFYDMQLYRGGTLVLPVRQGRVPMSVLADDSQAQAMDTAYGGVYFYDPSVFEPDEQLTRKMRRESNLDKWDIVNIDPKIQQRIWDQFAPYRQAVQQANIGSPAPSLQTTSVTIQHSVPTLAAPSAPAPAAQVASVAQTAPTAQASSLPPAQQASQVPPAPQPAIDPTVIGSSQHVIIATSDGNSYYGTVIKQDGAVYTVQTQQGTVQITSANIRSVQYPDKQ